MKLPARLAGSKARCPKCKNVFLIPASEGDVEAEAIAQPPASPPVDQQIDEPDRDPPIAAPTVPSTPEPLDAVATGPSNAPDSIGPPQDVAPNETTLPVAQAVPVDQATGSIPMATPVIEPTTAQNAMPEVGVVAPRKIRRRSKSGLKGMMGFILGLFALLGCLAILAGVGYWLSTRGPQNGTVVVNIPVEHRSECVLFVDGEDREINRVGQIEMVLAAGAHEIELRRLGFEPHKMQALVIARKDISITPNWIPVTEDDAAVDQPEIPQRQTPEETATELESPEEPVKEPATE